MESASERMSATDQLLWVGDRDPDLRSTVVSVVLLDGAPEYDDMVQRCDHMSRAVLRLRQRVRSNLVSIAPPRWELDPDFEASRHVNWIDDGQQRSLREVLDIAAAKALEPFPTDRPLWEVTGVCGLAEGHFALVQKVHHAVTDGINAVRIQLELFDFEPDAPPKETPEVPYHVPLSQVARMGDAVNWDLRRRAEVLDAGRRGAETVRTKPLTAAYSAAETVMSLARVGQLNNEPLSEVMTERDLTRHFDHLTLSLTEAKSAGKSAGTRLNAVFLVGLAEGLRNYHQVHGVDATQLRLGIPISTRTDDDTSNAFTGTRFVMPLVGDTLENRLRTMERLVKSHAGEAALQVLPALTAQVTQLPAPAAAKLLRRVMSGTDVQASNVPGSPLPMYLLGHRLLHQFPFGPTTISAMNITLLSYCDQLDIGIATNGAAVPDPDVLATCLAEGFETVIAAGRS
ncbi:MAG: wax ester/triacylglycerol synthase domain-containing protein [Acidimicrobiales bacterium]